MNGDKIPKSARKSVNTALADNMNTFAHAPEPYLLDGLFRFLIDNKSNAMVIMDHTMPTHEVCEKEFGSFNAEIATNGR